MSNNNTYTTTIFLNDEQAVNRLNALQANVENTAKLNNRLYWMVMTRHSRLRTSR